MRILRVESQILQLPLERPITPPANVPGTRFESVLVVLVEVVTDGPHRGLGYAWSIQGGGRAIKTLIDEDLTPLLVGEDPLDHERLATRVSQRFQGIGRSGLVRQAYSALDLALWDLKGKAAGLPLYKLLGGARESAPVYAADCGWLGMTPEEIVRAARGYLDQGVMGIKMRIGHPNPETDATRLGRVFDTLGDDVWFAVDANQKYDFARALHVGRFLDEDIRPDWYEEPLLCDDVEGYARLAERLETPIAGGESLFTPQEFEPFFERSALGVIQPDLTRVGGLTPLLEVAALARTHRCPVTPHLMPEIAVHLACGLPGVTAVEWMPWFFPLFVEVPQIVNGQIRPLPTPGLGLVVSPEARSRYAI